MFDSASGTGLVMPPYQFSWGGNNDLSSINSYSTQGASLFGGLGGGSTGLQIPGATPAVAGALPGVGGGGALSVGSSAAGNTGIFGGLGMNIPTLQLGLGLLSSIGGIYSGMQANKLARDQFNFNKGVTETNLTNQIKSYNTSLEDRARSRAVTEGRDQASADEYIARNRLTR
ncbi:hypothetical protein KMC60_gp57 [Achromobacter phage vB_AxyP_19-32_Axy11]|uniref:Uncharacterized protein n=2 Tax=Pourcelvirus Axy11 TaxID=2843622 RepID=A0A514CVX5_9CAUD|nr:hypothetical protein KMC60_gp57 [Achromobacter phage vB_AxyP_19-32_Axy11]QDH84030.1 hypothetical protein Axy11_058 [Achromobacter phage vB_AxyP_19-32_Axy11]QDH84626.1 hypothetical protein Axy22_055 [Achromobacter phage vB_AxyP_19-32_Axy22]